MKNFLKKIHAVRLIQVGFLCVVAVLFVFSLIRTVFSPKDISYYENRKANKIVAFSLDSFLNSEFQNGLEKALSDQVLMAERAKRYYNEVNSGLSFFVLQQIYRTNPNRYFKYNNIHVFNADYLVYRAGELNDSRKAGIEMKVESIHNLAKDCPELEVYAYFIEKDTDIDFETNQKVGYEAYVSSLLDQNLCRFAHFEINNFAEFSECFYHTDHHWNAVGSYKGYLGVCELLGIETPLVAGEKYVVGESMIGSKMASAGDYKSWSEPMYAYRFDFPEMTITINGKAASDYGNQNKTRQEFLEDGSSLSYGSFYGGDDGEIIFDTGREELDNILVIGESYDNAILKQIASHFDRTYSIDLRNYKYYMGTDFDARTYIQEHEIDRVLFIGNIDFYTMTEFNV